MVITQLKGGLGNQLFQYACGKALAIAYDQELFLDISFLLSQTHTTAEFTSRNFELGGFNLPDEIAAPELINKLNRNTYFDRFRYRLGFPAIHILDEQQFETKTKTKEIKFPLLLRGYWQSEKYFAMQKNEIRSLLSYLPGNPEVLRIAENIKMSNSIAIHFRRGDYVTNKLANNLLGLLPFSYYEKGIEVMKKKTKDCCYFLFTDDHEWLDQHFDLDIPYEIVSNGRFTALDEMYLMSICKHQIIANSSFSWWAAWLNNNPHKVVIAPMQWFAGTIGLAEHVDLIPSDWITLQGSQN